MAFIYDLADTWNNGGTTFTAIKMDVTDTASDAASLLMDLQVGGVSAFNVSKVGRVSAVNPTNNNTLWHTRPNGGFFVESGTSGGTNPRGYFLGGVGGSVDSDNNLYGMATRYGLNQPLAFWGGGSTPSIQIWSDRLDLGISVLSWYSSLSGSKNGGYDLVLTRDAANTLAQRNDTNAQTFNLYNTYTDASNYERGSMYWSSNILFIGPQKSGTGSSREFRLLGPSGQYIRFKTDTTVDFASTGSVNFSVANNRTDFKQTVRLAYDETVATLPASPTVGMISRVTDGDSGLTFGNTVVNSGAGATPYLVWYNGTNWTVIGA